MAPEQECLQYHTASSGTIASFNWDTSSSTVSATQYHLSSQYYDICIRRARNSCSVCYSPQIASIVTGTASSFGLSAGSVTDAQTSAVGSFCTGNTFFDTATTPAQRGLGDYLDITALQASIGTAGSISGTNRVCGVLFNAAAAATLHATACSWAVPFKVGVHFDADDVIDAADPTMLLETHENDVAGTTGAGFGFSGFYLAYWQNTC